MGDLFDAGVDVPYAERADRLRACGIALWDVLTLKNLGGGGNGCE